MRFQPKTNEQLQQEERDNSQLLPKGDYDFEIDTEPADATDEVSKVKRDPEGNIIGGGNDMIHLKLRVFTGVGSAWKFVDDYILESMGWKFKHAHEAVGLLENYEAGNISADDFKGKCGKVTLYIQKGKPKNDGSGEVYPDRNSVKDYVVDKSARTNKATAAFVASQGATRGGTDVLDDEVPF